MWGNKWKDVQAVLEYEKMSQEKLAAQYAPIFKELGMIKETKVITKRSKNKAARIARRIQRRNRK